MNHRQIMQQQELFQQMEQERERQIAKFGDQHWVPDVPEDEYLHTVPVFGENLCKAACDEAFKEQRGTMAHVAAEELAEVIDATTDEHRIEELMQLATVCMAWIESIRERQHKAQQEETGLCGETLLDDTLGPCKLPVDHHGCCSPLLR